jgi:hypothetical protein
MRDDEPKLFGYHVFSPEEYMAQHMANVGTEIDLHEFIPGVTHAIKLQSPTDATWAGMGPDFFYCEDTDALYAPPFFGEFRRAGEGAPGGSNSKVASRVPSIRSFYQ